MNINLLNVVKRIVSEQGESILAYPHKLNPLFKDYAKDESKEERIAFGRCIEIGAYQELKNSSSNRIQTKYNLATKLQTLTNYDIGLCNSTIDLLEAVIYNNSVPSQVNYSNNVQTSNYQQPSSNYNTNYQQNQSYYNAAPTSSMAKVGFFIGLINLLQLIIIIFNRQSINLPEENSAIIVLIWLVVTIILAIAGFIVSKNGYNEGSKGLGIAGMAFNGLIILPAIIFLLSSVLGSLGKTKNHNVTHRFR